MVGSAVYHYCTDDLTTEQRIAIPIVYVALWLFWVYCMLVVWSYYSEVAPADRRGQWEDEEEEKRAGLLRGQEMVPIMSLKDSQRIYPHSIWEESSVSSSTSEMRRGGRGSTKRSEREGSSPSRKKKGDSKRRKTASYRDHLSHHSRRRQQQQQQEQQQQQQQLLTKETSKSVRFDK